MQAPLLANCLASQMSYKLCYWLTGWDPNCHVSSVIDKPVGIPTVMWALLLTNRLGSRLSYKLCYWQTGWDPDCHTSSVIDKPVGIPTVMWALLLTNWLGSQLSYKLHYWLTVWDPNCHVCSVINNTCTTQVQVAFIKQEGIVFLELEYNYSSKCPNHSWMFPKQPKHVLMLLLI